MVYLISFLFLFLQQNLSFTDFTSYMDIIITPDKNCYKYSPSFQSYYKSSFSKQFEKMINTGCNKDEIINNFPGILKSRKNIKCKMGDGSNGEVFRIDDYFVFKTYYIHKPEVGEMKFYPDNRFKDLKVWWGKVIAKIGNIEIIRNAAKNRKDFLEMANPIDDGLSKYNYALKEFASLPQRAYDRLAGDFSILNSIQDASLYYKFDTNNPNNFVKVGKSIRIVDDIDWVPSKNSNDMFNLMRIFIKKDGDVTLKKEIFKKCVLACEKHQLPMDAVFAYLHGFMDQIFKNAGIRSNFEAYYDLMLDLRQNCKNDKIRMQKVREYVETL